MLRTQVDNLSYFIGAYRLEILGEVIKEQMHSIRESWLSRNQSACVLLNTEDFYYGTGPAKGQSSEIVGPGEERGDI